MLRPFIAVARPNVRVLAAVLSVSVLVVGCADAPTQPTRIVAHGPSRTIATGAVLADLAVSMTGAMQGKSITYTIALKNSGPNDATGVEVGDMLPSGTTFASISAPSDFTCLTPVAGNAGPVKCTAMSLANGASRTIQLVVKLVGSTKGAVSNTAAAVSSVSDPQTNNNSATVTLNVGKR